MMNFDSDDTFSSSDRSMAWIDFDVDQMKDILNELRSESAIVGVSKLLIHTILRDGLWFTRYRQSLTRDDHYELERKWSQFASQFLQTIMQVGVVAVALVNDDKLDQVPHVLDPRLFRYQFKIDRFGRRIYRVTHGSQSTRALPNTHWFFRDEPDLYGRLTSPCASILCPFKRKQHLERLARTMAQSMVLAPWFIEDHLNPLEVEDRKMNNRLYEKQCERFESELGMDSASMIDSDEAKSECASWLEEAEHKRKTVKSKKEIPTFQGEWIDFPENEQLAIRLQPGLRVQPINQNFPLFSALQESRTIFNQSITEAFSIPAIHWSGTGQLGGHQTASHIEHYRRSKIDAIWPWAILLEKSLNQLLNVIYKSNHNISQILQAELATLKEKKRTQKARDKAWTLIEKQLKQHINMGKLVCSWVRQLDGPEKDAYEKAVMDGDIQSLSAVKEEDDVGSSTLNANKLKQKDVEDMKEEKKSTQTVSEGETNKKKEEGDEEDEENQKKKKTQPTKENGKKQKKEEGEEDTSLEKGLVDMLPVDKTKKKKLTKDLIEAEKKKGASKTSKEKEHEKECDDDDDDDDVCPLCSQHDVKGLKNMEIQDLDNLFAWVVDEIAALHNKMTRSLSDEVLQRKMLHLLGHTRHITGLIKRISSSAWVESEEKVNLRAHLSLDEKEIQIQEEETHQSSLIVVRIRWVEQVKLARERNAMHERDNQLMETMKGSATFLSKQPFIQLSDLGHLEIVPKEVKEVKEVKTSTKSTSSTSTRNTSSSSLKRKRQLEDREEEREEEDETNKKEEKKNGKKKVVSKPKTLAKDKVEGEGEEVEEEEVEKGGETGEPPQKTTKRSQTSKRSKQSK